MVYLPPVFVEARREVLIAHIAAHDFGLMITHGAAGMVASHIPFLAEERDGTLCLQGHLAKPNPQVADLVAGGETSAIFAGPHAYISPTWYAAGPAVPTWNYADVHAYGPVRAIDDRAWLRGLLDRLSTKHEGGNTPPWRMTDAPAAYLDGMLNGIVGFEIAVTRLEGKFKLSQNRPAADRPRVIAALERQDGDAGQGVARLMRERASAG